jgi:hypothetical protein
MLAFQVFRPRLMTERIAAASEAPPVAVISENSIAVLPFTDMSEAKDQGYFSDGISEELLNLLTTSLSFRLPNSYFRSLPTFCFSSSGPPLQNHLSIPRPPLPTHHNNPKP